MIPKFTSHGELPPGIHQTTMQELSRALAWNQWRETLVGHLKLTWRELHQCCINEFFLNGSFTTAKPIPKDIDAFWTYTEQVDVGRLEAEFPHLLDRIWMQTHRSMDLLVAEDEVARSAWLSFFTHNRAGQEKGILLLTKSEEVTV